MSSAEKKPESEARMRGQVQTATQAQIQVLIDNASQIISDVGGEIEGSEAQRHLAVFFRSGVLVMEKKSKWNSHIMAFREIIRRRGYQIREEVYVDLEVIRILYETFQKTLATDKDPLMMTTSRGGHGGKEGVTPMQKEVIKLLTHAASLKASDIHVTVGYHEAQVRMRLDGDLYNMYQMPADVAHELLAAAYNMSDTADASYRILEYQAARISSRKSPLPQGLQGVRLQFNPLEAGGRYLIARMLYAEDRSKKLEVGDLGFHGVHIGSFDRMRARPEGVNFISGPTGSGKSTTLKIALEAVYRDRQAKINILTIEDPPEYTIHGAAQLPVTNVETEEDRGAAYNKAIVAALRSDPDVIMPGEARDRNVINLVFTAAMTGHQVWTSIHANSAMAIFDRVKDQGVEAYKLYDPDLVTGLLAQRLLRQLCPHCKISLQQGLTTQVKENAVKKSTLASIVKLSRDFLNNIFLVNRTGCSKCSGGYKGRSVVAEIIVPDYDFMELVRQDKKPVAIKYYEDHLEGMNMKEHAWLKMINGIVDPRDLEDRLGPLSMINKERIPALLAIEEKYKNV